MRAGNADLQEERPVPAVGVDPVRGQVGHEIVRVQLGRQVPHEGAEPFAVVGQAAVRDAARLLEPGGPDRLVPIVHEVGKGGVRPVLVLRHVALVEAERFLEWRGVHLAHVHGAVAGVGQLLHPGVRPALVVAEHAVGVGIQPGEQAGAGGCAGGCGHEHAAEGGAFAHEVVEVRGDHVGEAAGGDGVEALLVGDDEDDIRLVHS